MVNPKVKSKDKLKTTWRVWFVGLCKRPADCDSHPAATEIAIKSLVEICETAPVQTGLKPQKGGGWQLYLALRWLTLDSIWRVLMQSQSPIAEEIEQPGIEQDEASLAKLSDLETLGAGLIIVWYRYITYAMRDDVSSDEFTPYGDIVENCMSPDFLDVLFEANADLNKWPRSKVEAWRQWIVRVFTALRGTKSWDTNARHYCDEALLHLLQQRIEPAINVAGLELGEIWPEVVDNYVHPGVAAWAERLSQCVADYRAYESAKIERFLDEQELPHVWNWFVARKVCRPTNWPGCDDIAAAENLADICNPKTQTALLDQRGSGTSTALLWLSRQYCTNAANIEPAVLRIDAREYTRSATGESPFRFVARQVYGTDHTNAAKWQEFEDALSRATFICLVDNLARLSLARQIEIGRKLSLFSGTVFTISPGTLSEDLESIGGKDTLRAALAPLDKTHISHFISKFAAERGPDFGTDLARHIAKQELPDTASTPLGLRIICEHVRVHKSDCASIMMSFIDELFRRDERPIPQWNQRSVELPSAIAVLIRMAVFRYAAYVHRAETGGFSLDFTEEQALASLGDWKNPPWPEAKLLPLLVPTSPTTYRVYNQEVFGFLVAIDAARNGVGQCSWESAPDIFREDIIGVANRHYLALVRSDSSV